jgi:DNA polymerase-3 subunit epsilon
MAGQERKMDQEQMALALEATGQYRVLRRFVPAESYQLDDEKIEANRVRSVLVVDVETTGLKKDWDKIIDIGLVLAEFDRVSGQVLRVLERYSGFEDPGRPIPEEITRLTGIRDEDVLGQTFDDARVDALIARADLVVAHNAPFDRGFLELRFPSFQRKWWACSQREAPWSQMMTGSTKLEWLAFQIGGCFYDAHRALVDAEVTLFILSRMGPGGRPILSHLLEVSGRKTYCVWAEGAPFDAKDKLKLEMGYSWSDGASPDKPIKAWFKQGVVDLDAELETLARTVYLKSSVVTVDAMTGYERFTDRYHARDKRSLPELQVEAPVPVPAPSVEPTPSSVPVHGLPL